MRLFNQTYSLVIFLIFSYYCFIFYVYRLISTLLTGKYYVDHSLSQSGKAIYYLRNISTHRLYTSLNRSAVIAVAAELLAYN